MVGRSKAQLLWLDACKKYNRPKEDSRPLTHTLLSGAPAKGLAGCLHVPTEELSEFYRVYAAAAAETTQAQRIFKPSNSLLSVSEICADKGNHILMFDLDMKLHVEQNPRNFELTPTRFDTLFTVVRDAVRELFPEADPTCICGTCFSYTPQLQRLWFTDTTHSLPDGSSISCKKFGFHIFFPCIFVNAETQLFARKFLIDYLDKQPNFSDKRLVLPGGVILALVEEGGWKKAVDLIVARNVVCRLFGCCKVKRCSQPQPQPSAAPDASLSQQQRQQQQQPIRARKINEQRIYSITNFYDATGSSDASRVEDLKADLPSLLELTSLRRCTEDELAPLNELYSVTAFDDDPRFADEVAKGKSGNCKLDVKLVEDLHLQTTLKMITHRVYPFARVTYMGVAATEKKCREEKFDRDDEAGAEDEAAADMSKKTKRVAGFRVDLADVICHNKGSKHNQCRDGFLWITRQCISLCCRCEHADKLIDTRAFGLVCAEFALKSLLSKRERVALFGADKFDPTAAPEYEPNSSAEMRIVADMGSTFVR